MDTDIITPDDIHIWVVDGEHAQMVHPERMAWLQDGAETFTGTQSELLDKLNAGQKIKVWVAQGPAAATRRNPFASTVSEAIEYLEQEQTTEHSVQIDSKSIDNELKRKIVLASRTRERMLRYGSVWLKWQWGGFSAVRASKRRKSSKRIQRKLTTVNLLNAMHGELYQMFKINIRQLEWDLNKVKAISEIFIKLTSKKVYMRQFGQIIHNLADEVARVRARSTPPREDKFGRGWSEEFGDWILEQEKQRKRTHIGLKPKSVEDEMLQHELKRAGVI